jgi:2-polyprenyl-3-methyl-5-hydroxy-6-metoxy-1,4-benzoquinol methylase
MYYDLYKEMEKQRGKYAEYGNVELSYDYIMKVVDLYKIKQNAKMLDIGTNLGTLPYLLHLRGNKLMYGVEMRNEAIERGKKKYSVIADRLSVIGDSLASIEDDSFELISMFDVIEHIPNIDDYLKKDVFRVLKTGGIFVFQTPNARINPIFEIIRTRSLTAYKSYHCSLQTPKSLERMLRKSGFENIIIEKNMIDSEFNKRKLENYLGPLGIVALKFFEKMPLGLYPNLWGYCTKPE